MSITTKAKIENYLMTNINDNFNTQITEWIDSVTKYIENYTGRVFEADTDTTKYYDGKEQEELLIDDTYAVTSVQILDDSGDVEKTLEEGLGNDYVLYPANTTQKNSIKLLSTACYAVFPKGNQNIKIVAKFGMASTVPADIELVATKLVSAIIQKGLRGGEIKAEKLGDYSVSFIEEQAEEMGVKSILDAYIIYEI